MIFPQLPRPKRVCREDAWPERVSGCVIYIYLFLVKESAAQDVEIILPAIQYGPDLMVLDEIQPLFCGRPRHRRD
jgi:hypothetical protein